MAEFIIPSIQKELAEARKVVTEGVLVKGMNLMNSLPDNQDVVDLELQDFVAIMFRRVIKSR